MRIWKEIPMRFRFSTALLASATLFLNEARAGGGEHYCNGSTELKEFWPSPGNIQWEVRTLQCFVSQWMISGYPRFGCTLAETSSGNVDEYLQNGGKLTDFPGLQSLIFAAQSWSNAAMPLAGGDGPLAGGSGSAAGSSGSILPSGIAYAPPTIPTGGSGGGPSAYLGVKASTFSLAQPTIVNYDANWQNFWPNFCVLLGINDPVSNTDGVNSITFLEGGLFSPFELARTPVRVTLSTGAIQEADILFNPAWSWVEFNIKTATWFASSPSSTSSASIEGVAAHEFGHLAGLGHSLIDSTSTPAGSLFPTMFPFSQQEPFGPLMVNDPSYSAGLCSDPVTTPAGFLFGPSAASLQPDDIAAIGDLYPTSKFLSKLGTIQGTVTQKSSGGSISAAPGASVVAVHKSLPDKFRIATLSYSGGSYTLRGLPPGDYFLYVEPVDQGPPGSGSYFPNDVTVPNFVFQGPTGCPGIATGFPIEFFDENESYEESNFSAAQMLSVQAGQALGGVDFKVKPSGPQDLLEVGPQGGALSPRGAQVNSSTTSNLQFRVRDVSKPGAAAVLWISLSRSNTSVSGSLFQNLLTTTTSQFVGTLNGAGEWSNFMPTAGLSYFNVFAQAAVVDSLGNGAVSNAANAWIFQ